MEPNQLLTDFILKLKSYLEKDSPYSHTIKMTADTDRRYHTTFNTNICHYYIDKVYIFSVLSESKDPLKAYIYVNHLYRLSDLSVTLDLVHNLEDIKNHVHKLYLKNIKDKLIKVHQKQLELETKLILIS
jgi:hypothetical protein